MPRHDEKPAPAIGGRDTLMCSHCKQQFRPDPNLQLAKCPFCGVRLQIVNPTFKR